MWMSGFFGNVAGTALDVVLSTRNPVGWNLSVSPSMVNIPPGATQIITVNASATLLPGPNWAFGGITLTPSSGPIQDLPVALSFDVSLSSSSGTYNMTNSLTDPACDTGFGGYLDLENFAIFPDPAVTGNSMSWSAFGSQDPIGFYGGSYPGINFTDDGFAFFSGTAGATPWTPQTLPDPADPNNLMAMLWSNLEIVYNATPGAVRGVSLATAGDNVSIIEYDDPEPFPVGSSTPVGDFEVIVYGAINDAVNSPEIVFAFDNLQASLPAIATVGVESGDASHAVAFLNREDASVLTNGLMICYDFQTGCKEYLTLDNGVVSGAETHSATKSIFAGDSFTVDSGGELVLNTAPGGSVTLYPGFSVVNGALLTVNTNSGSCP